MRGADPTPAHLQVASDAMNAAEEGPAYQSYWQKLFAPSLETVKADYQDLAQGWDAEGWSGNTIVLFSRFMNHAEERAGQYAWNEERDLGVRRKQIGEELKGMTGPPVTPTAIEQVLDTGRQFANNIGRGLGISFDFLRSWGLILLAAAIAFLFLYLIRPWIMAYSAHRSATRT